VSSTDDGVPNTDGGESNTDDGVSDTDCGVCRSLDLAGNSLDTSCGFVLATLAGHDHFIYALAVCPAK